MMPSAQQVTMKPKLAFSIESIVGKSNRLKNSSPGNYCDNRDDEKIDADEYLSLINRAKNLASNNLEKEYDKTIVRKKTLSESSDKQHNDNNNDSFSKNNNNDDSDSKKSRSPSPVKQFPQQTLIRPMVIPQHHQQYSDAPHPHLLAQFQAAAALANVQAVQNGFHQHLPPHLHNPNMPRESYPLYPWLLSRHGRIFPHRFPGSEYKLF